MTSLYTVIAIRHIVDDLKRIALWVKLSSILLYTVYLVYSIVTMTGYVFIKALLLLATVAYFVVYIILQRKTDGPARSTKRRYDKIYRVFKIVMNGLTLALTVWGFVSLNERATVTAILLAVGMAIGWTFSVLFELVCDFLTKRFNLISEAIAMDVETITKPVTTVKSVVDKLTGKEAEPEVKPSKARTLLIKYSEEEKAERQEKREKRKREKQEQRERKRNERRKSAPEDSDGTIDVDTPPALPAPSDKPERKRTRKRDEKKI